MVRGLLPKVVPDLPHQSGGGLLHQDALPAKVVRALLTKVGRGLQPRWWVVRGFLQGGAWLATQGGMWLATQGGAWLAT
jgi:hypothetical protein